jgi:hypothetical protein
LKSNKYKEKKINEVIKTIKNNILKLTIEILKFKFSKEIIIKKIKEIPFKTDKINIKFINVILIILRKKKINKEIDNIKITKILLMKFIFKKNMYMDSKIIVNNFIIITKKINDLQNHSKFS